jgi:hypothetical protein
MAKDPAILFYTSDFLSGVMDLDMEERGQYITLLCAQHQKGHLSEKTTRLLVGSVSVSVMAKFKKDEKGLLFNERMDEEINKRIKFIDSRSLNGKLGGRPKASDKPNALPSEKLVPNHTPKLPENENENRNDNIIVDVIEEIPLAEIYPTFEDFWNLYDRKEDKKDAIKKWEKLNQLEKEYIMSFIPNYKLSLSDLKYQRNPVTFLNKRTWENELPKSTNNGTKPSRKSATIEDYVNKYAGQSWTKNE